jgi:phosphoglycolate phosphatase
MSDASKILVIFDLDFTLIDNSITICKAFEYALAKFQVPIPKKADITKTIGIPLKDAFLEYLGEADAEKAITYFREYYSSHYFEDVKFIPGALDLLRQLQALGYRMALLTSKRTDLAIKLLEYYQLKRYFEVILGEQKEFRPKPAPDSLHYILAQFLEIDKAFMVGDHVVDCLAARSAGICFIGVLTGNTTMQQLRDCAGNEAIILENIARIKPMIHLI